MNRLIKYLKNYRINCLIGSGFKLIEAVFELIVPLVVASIINNGINSNMPEHIWKMAAVLFLLSAGGMFFSITAQYYSAKAACGFASDVRSKMFEKVQSFSFSKLDKLGTSTIITRLTSDINQVQNGVNMGLRLLLRAPVIVFGAMIMAFTVDAKAAIIFTVVVPVLFILVFFILILGIKLYKRVQSSLDELIGDYRENLKGIKVLRAFCRKESEIKDYQKKNKAFEKVQLYSGRFMSAINPLTLLIVNIGIIIILKSGAVSSAQGSISQGQVVALVNYMSQILVELLKFANLIITLSRAFAGADRIADFLDIETDEIRKNKTIVSNNDCLFELKNMCFSYNKGNEAVLENINFSIQRGERIGIIGGTGSGKSTLVNLLCGFYNADEGEIFYKGKNINEYNRKELLSQITIVAQKSVLFSGTIRSNLQWGKKDADKTEIKKALEIAQAEFALEMGIDSVVEQEGRNFSGGQRQRLSIARSLIKSPEVLILDDSSSALDYLTESRLRRAINENIDACIITISQRVSSVIKADRILVLEDGRQQGFGTHEELIQNCEIYREIYFAQFPEDMVNEK